MRNYLKDQIDGKPYALVQTPRSGLGLGSVYTNYRGQSLAYATPEDCVSADVLQKFTAVDLEIPQSNSQSSYSWQVGLKVAAAGAITSEAKAEFDRKKVRNMVLSVPKMTREFWSIKQLKDIVGTKTSESCKQDLTKGDPERWIVFDLLTSKSMKLEFKQDGGTNASVSVGILKLLFRQRSTTHRRQQPVS